MPAPTMEGLIISSTTDSQADVDRAMAHALGTAPVEEVEEVPPVEQETATENDSEEGAEATEGEPKKKGKGGFLKKIDKLTRQRREAEDRAEKAERRAAEAEARVAGKPADTATQAKSAAPDGRPKLADFETPEEWGEALTDWKLEQRDAKTKQAADDAKAKEAQKSYSERLEKFKDSVDDWEEVAEEIREKGIAVPRLVETAIRESEIGPALVYHLAKHPDIVAKLNSLSETAAVRELGKIEAKLSPEESDAPEEKPKTKAPAPINPVGGASKRTASIHDPNISTEQYREIRLAQRRGR